MAEKQSLSAKTLRRTKPVSKSELAQNQMKSTTRRNKPGTGGDEGSGIYDMSNIGRTSYSGHGEDSIDVSGPGQGKPKVGKVKSYKVDPKTLKDEYEVQSEAAAWTRKAGKNPSGGLNEKGRKSYERANPGSDLKACLLYTSDAADEP